MAQVIACALQLGGMPVPRGGGVRLVRALAGIVRDARRRGAHRTPTSSASSVAAGRARGVRLAGGERVTASRAVIARVTPGALYGRLLERATRPRRSASAARGFATAGRDADPPRACATAALEGRRAAERTARSST